MNIIDSKHPKVKEIIKSLKPNPVTDALIYEALQAVKIDVFHIVGCGLDKETDKLIHEIVLISEDEMDSADEDFDDYEDYITYTLNEKVDEWEQAYFRVVALTHAVFTQLKTL